MKTENELTKDLIEKLGKVLAGIDRVKKNGRNAFHKYDYVTESDILDAVRAKLSDNGIFIFTSQEEISSTEIKRLTSGQEKISISTRVKLRHTITDGEGVFEVTSYGESEDSGDKGLYKAITGGMKYFVSKNFLMSTGDDPETSSPEQHGEIKKEPLKVELKTAIKSVDAKNNSPIEQVFEDSVLGVAVIERLDKNGKPYKIYKIQTSENGEVQTVYESLGKQATLHAGTGEVLYLTVDASKSQYKPQLKKITLKEF